MPENIKKLVAEGNKAFGRKKYKKAQKYYEQALKLDPKNQIISFNLGVTYQSQGQNSQALTYYERAGDFVDAKNNLGVIFEEQGDLEKAREYYQQALGLSPWYKEAKENLAALEKRMGGEKSKRGVDKVNKVNGFGKLTTGKVNRVDKDEEIGNLSQPEADHPLGENKEITDIPQEIRDKIRKSFNYKGLLKALKDGVISVSDIKVEAGREAKNPHLAPGERLHTVLLEDLETGIDTEEKQIKTDKGRIRTPAYQSYRPPAPRKLRGALRAGLAIAGRDDTAGVNKVNKVNRVNKIVNKDEAMGELKERFGEDFKPGWQGIDKDGDLVELTEMTADGWIKFNIEKPRGKTDVFTLPANKFLEELKANPLYEISPEEAAELAAESLVKLDNKGRIELIKKIHQRAMAKLRNIKARQRVTIGQILKRSEVRKIEETLAKIRES